MNKKKNISTLNRLSVEAFKTTEKLPIIVVLDNIRSMNNIGSVFRTSDAFLIEAIYLCGYTAQPPHRDINKTALGATDTIEWKYFENTLDAVTHLKTKNYKIASIEQAENATMLQDFNLTKEKGIALIFGNEVKGVDQKIVDTSDVCIEIPQFGSKHSFNVSVTAGIVLWQIASKLLIK